MSTISNFTASEKAQTFVSSIEKAKYDRQITAGLKKFIDKSVAAEMQGFYSEDELAALVEIKGTERDIESRMPVKITRHYFEQAKNSAAIQQFNQSEPC